MNVAQLIQYYQNLLIIQYNTQPKALAHIGCLGGMAAFAQWTQEQIVFSDVAASGHFQLSWGGNQTSVLQWNATTPQIQNAVNALVGLGMVTVQGSIASKSLQFVFIGVAPAAGSITVVSSTLENASSVAITAVTSILENGDANYTLPQAIQNGFTLGTVSGAVAFGSRLDSIGKYAGVTRYGNNFSGPMTLNDDQFTILILIAIIKNSATSDFFSIQALIYRFFQGVINVWDHQDMRMSYYFDAAIGTQQLAEFFVLGGFLPKPMGVQVATVTYAPNILTKNFLGFRTDLVPLYNASGANTYSSYSSSKPWLTYSLGVN